MDGDKINKPEEIQEEILDKATGGSSIPIMMYTCKVCGKEISFDEKKKNDGLCNKCKSQGGGATGGW